MRTLLNLSNAVKTTTIRHFQVTISKPFLQSNKHCVTPRVFKITMSTYKGQAAPAVPSKVSKFYENFYAVSDNSDPSTHDQYANAFTKDGTLVMGLKTVNGYDQILELRKGLWAGPVIKRLHTLERIYAFGEDGMDIMLFGNVVYGLKNGKNVTVEWAGRANLVEEGEEDIKMKFYQVYLDSSVVANAMKD